jgi:hypothetical protein
MQFAYLPGFVWADYLMISPPTEMGKRPTSTESVSSKRVKFSKNRPAAAFVIAGTSDVIGAFATLAPPIVWAVDIGTALLLFVILGWQWLLLPGPWRPFRALGRSILATGSWRDCFPRQAAEDWTALMIMTRPGPQKNVKRELDFDRVVNRRQRH